MRAPPDQEVNPLKSLLIASLFAVYPAAAMAADGPYELRLRAVNGERTVAVINGVTGGYAIATGGEDLDLLSPDDAKPALEALIETPAFDAPPERDAAIDPRTGKRRVVVHKMDFEDGGGVEGSAQSEADRGARILRRIGPGADRRTEEPQSGADDLRGSQEDEFALDDDAVEEDRRMVLIRGADAARAEKFIDDTDGMAEDEKRAMKEAVGL